MAYLEILEGPLQGHNFPLEGKVTIGRNSNNTLYLNDTSVSRQHAEIWFKDNHYSIIDLGSANGTFLNNEMIHRLVPRRLYSKDEIVIGSNRIIFHEEGTGQKHRSTVETGTNLDFDATRAQKIPNISVVMTTEESHPMVNVTLDASHPFLDTTVSPTPESILESVKRLQAMVKISIDLGATFKPENLAERIMSGIFDVIPHADRAFIMLRDFKTHELIPVLGRKRTNDEAKEDFPLSTTIVSTVVNQKQAILSSDAQHDKRFAEKKSVVNLSIRSFMCAPFIYKDEILGILCVDTISRQHAFNEDDLQMLTSIASQAAVALKNAELFGAVEREVRIRTQLSRYLSKDVVEGILDGKISLQLGGEKKKGTILFCDIVGFTSIAENLSADEVVQRLNRYFSIVTEIVSRNRGTLHKFGGDMLMAFWNVMFPDMSAEENTVKTGLEMQNAVYHFDLDLESEGQRPIYLGIGCHTGEFAGGNIGGNERMEYTVIGDNVNLAQRIETMACRWQVLISSDTYSPLKEKCIAVQLPPSVVKGRVQPIIVYSVRGIQLDNLNLLLNIPVIIMTPDGNVIGGGMITCHRVVNDVPELHMSTFASIPPWSNLIIQFDMPELSRALHLRGKVAAAFRVTHEGRSTYSKVILTGMTGDEDALQFLKAGTLLESKKNWLDMKRH